MCWALICLEIGQMRFGGGALFGRLAAGVFILLALMFSAPIASAHAHGMDTTSHSVSSTKQITVNQTPTRHRHGKGCDDGSCCLLSQCSQADTLLSSDIAVLQGYRKVTRNYAGNPGSIFSGIRSGPATPPPRLDA